MPCSATREILPGRLAWAPELLGTAGASGGELALERLCWHGLEKDEHPGRLSRPRGFERLLRFCRGLEAELAGWPTGADPLVFATRQGESEERAESAVMLGAYLLLRLEWSVPRVADCLGIAEGCAKLARPCARAAGQRAQSGLLSVRDCWLGIQFARILGWVNGEFIEDDSEMEAQCKEYRDQLKQFDSTWIIPGRILVGSPLTTDASTSELLSSDSVKASHSSCARSSPRWPSLSTACTESDHQMPLRKPNDADRRADLTASLDEEGEEGASTAGWCDWVQFLEESGVGMVVRIDCEEKGIPGDGTADQELKSSGISLASIQVAGDGGGCIPEPLAVACMLETCDGFVEGEGRDAVMVQCCKDGCGQSFLLACCLAISRFDVPGKAFLGWSRVIRPGCIACQEQEAFLKSLNSAQDVLRYAKRTASWPSERDPEALLKAVNSPYRQLMAVKRAEEQPVGKGGGKAGVKVSCTGCQIQ